MSGVALPIDGMSELPRGERLLSDERLARRASRGSTRAFAALDERHHQALYRYCRSIVRDDQDAEDALQSAMTRAYAALCDRERDLAVRPWLFRIAHNEAVSILRKRGPEYRDPEHVSISGEACESLDGGVERTLEVRERLTLLVADLRALPERQRAALLMRECSGLSISEIAGAMSTSQGTARQTLFEARSSLHELAEGRAMECEAVRQAISARDGRVLRGRRIRSHLRACAGCREFRAAIGAREADLRALAPPLPASVASAMLGRLLAHGGGGHAGGAAVTSSAGASSAGASSTGASSAGASLGGHVAAPILAKGIVGVAVLAATTAGAVHLTAHHHHHRTAVTTSATAVAGADVRGAADRYGTPGRHGGLSPVKVESRALRAARPRQAKASAGARRLGTGGLRTGGHPGTDEHPPGAGITGAQPPTTARSVKGPPGESPANHAAAGKGRSGAVAGHRAQGRTSHPGVGHGSHSPAGHHASPPHKSAHSKPAHAHSADGETSQATPEPGEAPGHGTGGAESHQPSTHETSSGSQARNTGK